MRTDWHIEKTQKRRYIRNHLVVRSWHSYALHTTGRQIVEKGVKPTFISRYYLFGQLPCPRRPRVAATYNHEQIRAALAQNDLALSFYLDLETGNVIKISETESSPENDQLRDQVMEGYGDRYRYIPGGNAAADDSAVAAWLDAEGL